MAVVEVRERRRRGDGEEKVEGEEDDGNDGCGEKRTVMIGGVG